MKQMNVETNRVKPNSSEMQKGCCTTESYGGAIEKCIQDNPGTSMLLGAVAGIGVGVCIGLMLGKTNDAEPVGWFETKTAEKIGQQFLSTMARMVPESVSSRFS